MTSTPVKDVGSVLGMAGGAGANVKKAAGGFQAVLDSRTDAGAPKPKEESVSAKESGGVKKTPGDSLKARDAHRARVRDGEPAPEEMQPQETGGEITEEKLEEILSVLGTAAEDLIRQIADAFGVDVKELSQVMGELGMDRMDVLNPEKLSGLLLKLAGAEDVYELVTNDGLYESYRNLTQTADSLLDQAAKELEISPGQLEEILETPQTEPEEMPEISVLADTQQRETAPETLLGSEKPEIPEEKETPVDVPVAEKAEGQDTGREQIGNREEGDAQRRSDSRRDGHEQAVWQNVRAESFRTGFDVSMQRTEAPAQTFTSQTQDIMRQIMDYMRIQVRPEISNLEMQLHPENLGTLHIQITSKGGALTAGFVAQNETVKAALESQIVQLKESFEQQGLKVDAVEVTVQSHAFERNLDQGRGQESRQDKESRRTRIRRFQPEDSAEIGNPEDEALNAEMMAVNGSQVDYTA